MVKTYQVTLTASAQRVSTVLFATDESKNVPFRQLTIQAVGADAVLGSDATVTAGTGFKVALAAPLPLTLGPFSTGPLKLSDLYALGTGATLSIIGVPF
jgi:hypothetical protein